VQLVVTVFLEVHRIVAPAFLVTLGVHNLLLVQGLQHLIQVFAQHLDHHHYQYVYCWGNLDHFP